MFLTMAETYNKGSKNLTTINHSKRNNVIWLESIFLLCERLNPSVSEIFEPYERVKLH